MRLELARPYFLLLLLLLIPLVIFSAKKLYTQAKSRRVFQIVTRSILFLCIVLALSGLSVKWVTRKTTTIFLVDVSDSVREQTTEVIRTVNEAVAKKGSKDFVGVIAFGSDAQVEQFVSKEVVFSELQTDVNKTATDIESAINMAVGLIPEDSAKRIVLITDGNENEGSIKNTVSSIAAGNVKVLVMKLKENTSDEVYVSDISLPESVGTGEQFNINVKIESNVATTARVSLYLGRTLKGYQDVTIQKGTNNYIFVDTQSEEGLKTYNVIIEPANDTVTVNNEYSAYTNISTKLPLLLVEGKRGQAQEIEGILKSIGVRYELYQPAAVPNTLAELMNYSGVIFVDVYNDDLRSGFAEALEDYVRNYGGGFIATGGQNSYAIGGYTGTPLESVLPVNMRLDSQQEIPTMVYTMVIDHSGSMSAGYGNVSNLDLAKEAAVAALGNIRDEDYVGVMTFDDSYHWIVPIQKADSRDAIQAEIEAIGDGGGTSIYPALKEAVIQEMKNDAKVKHIILLTDGEDGMPFDTYSDVLTAAKQSGITISTVAVGDGANNALLNNIAAACDGRTYVTDYTTDIPRIFAQEVYLSAESYLKNGDFYPSVTNSHTILTGVTEDGIPALRGYVATTPKDHSIVLMRSDEGYPILSTWQCGLGKTIAWTSDFTGEWSQNWSGKDGTQKLWANMISYVTQQSVVEGAYADILQEGKKANIQYNTGEFTGKTTVIATITDADGNQKEIELEPNKPGQYQSSFDMNNTGVYNISIKQYEDGEIKGNLNTAAIMQYSMEYQFMNARNYLDSYVASVDGEIIEKADEVFKTPLEMVKSKVDLGMLLLLLACILLLFDIAVRRFHFDPFRNSARRRAMKEEKKAKALAAKKAKQAARRKEDATATSAEATKTVSTQTAAKTTTAKTAKPKVKAEQTPKTNTSKKQPQKEMLDASSLLDRMKK